MIYFFTFSMNFNFFHQTLMENTFKSLLFCTDIFDRVQKLAFYISKRDGKFKKSFLPHNYSIKKTNNYRKSEN